MVEGTGNAELSDLPACWLDGKELLIRLSHVSTPARPHWPNLNAAPESDTCLQSPMLETDRRFVLPESRDCAEAGCGVGSFECNFQPVIRLMVYQLCLQDTAQSLFNKMVCILSCRTCAGVCTAVIQSAPDLCCLEKPALNDFRRPSVRGASAVMTI